LDLWTGKKLKKKKSAIRRCLVIFFRPGGCKLAIFDGEVAPGVKLLTSAAGVATLFKGEPFSMEDGGLWLFRN